MKRPHYAVSVSSVCHVTYLSPSVLLQVITVCFQVLAYWLEISAEYKPVSVATFTMRLLSLLMDMEKPGRPVVITRDTVAL